MRNKTGELFIILAISQNVCAVLRKELDSVIAFRKFQKDIPKGEKNASLGIHI